MRALNTSLWKGPINTELCILFQAVDVSNLILNIGCVREGINSYFGGYKCKSNENKVIYAYMYSKCSFTFQGLG